MSFKNLEQRMAQTYLDTFPPFKPLERDCRSAEQEAFYHLIRTLYQTAYHEPELWVSRLHDDDVYTNRYNKASENKPELQKNMHLFTQAMDDLLAVMFKLGIDRSNVSLSQRQKVILSRLGIKENGPLPEAWTWMSRREGAGILAFSHCLFDPDYPYARDILAALLGPVPVFQRLENWLSAHGYTRFHNLNGQIALDYANPAWSPEVPRGGFMFKIKHTGISFNYEKWVEKPAIAGLCIPGGLKEALQHFGEMPESLQEFVLARTKQCDSCGYCVQTDKSGSRPRAFIPVIHRDRRYNLCPLFPGYAYCWTSLDDQLVTSVTAMLSFLDGLRGSGKSG